MNTQSIAYRDGDIPLTGFLIWDDTKDDKRPGVLVVHGGAGLDAHAKERARRLAALGFVTFARDMYGDGVAGDRQRVMTRIQELTDDPVLLCKRARAGIEALASHPNVDKERMAAVGYCFGGMTVLELARDGVELAGVVSVHASLKTNRPAQTSRVKAKVLVCHGALDPHVPMTHVTAFADEMNSAGVDWELTIYGGAMHGFTHEGAAAVFRASPITHSRTRDPQARWRHSSLRSSPLVGRLDFDAGSGGQTIRRVRNSSIKVATSVSP